MPDGIITDVNRQMEALTGCTRDELIGAPFKNYFTDPARAEAGIKLVLREKKLTNYELTARARDGKTTVVSYNATTFYDRDRTLQGVFAAARDVTERKHIEQMLQEKNVELETAKSVAEQTVVRLEEVEQLKKGFLSTVSHELRTPLTSIRGALGLLASGAVGPCRRKWSRSSACRTQRGPPDGAHRRHPRSGAARDRKDRVANLPTSPWPRSCAARWSRSRRSAHRGHD